MKTAKTSRDITTKKETAARERASGQFLEQLIDTIPLPALAKDTFGVYPLCNSQFEYTCP
jgi:hypothetical protein